MRRTDALRRFGPGYFDLIVIDEAHRSVYQKYGAIFQYFDSLLVGLTATPKDEVDHNTYSLFNLEDGVPTDSYDLTDAIAEGYLVPPVGRSIATKFVRQGIRYDDLSHDEQEAWDLLDWEDGVVPDEVDAAAVNNWLFNADTVDKVLETLMTEGRKVAGGDKLGKTIVFARSKKHAEFIVERFDANYPEHRGAFARVIVFGEHLCAEPHRRLLSQTTKLPQIAISVDMLDTGIDVPDIVNLVFFKPVYSKTKYWQMVGRGTRLRPDLYGPCDDKKDFVIFDVCQNIEYFNAEVPSVSPSASPPLGSRLFTGRLALLAAIDQMVDDAELVALREGLAANLHSTVAGMSLDNFLVRPRRREVERFAAGSGGFRSQTLTTRMRRRSPGCPRRPTCSTRMSRRSVSTCSPCARSSGCSLAMLHLRPRRSASRRSRRPWGSRRASRRCSARSTSSRRSPVRTGGWMSRCRCSN